MSLHVGRSRILVRVPRSARSKHVGTEDEPLVATTRGTLTQSSYQDIDLPKEAYTERNINERTLPLVLANAPVASYLLSRSTQSP